MKSKHFSIPGHGGNKPHHGTSQRQHHDGHPHGHPTQHGLSENPLPNVGMGGPDYGSMAEHGLSEGNVKGLKTALPESQCNNSILEEHVLQHTDYGNLTGNNFNTASYGREGSKDEY
jgi:hypothetical protein